MVKRTRSKSGVGLPVVVLAAVAICAGSAPAALYTYGFERITFNSPDVGPELSMDVTGASAGSHVSFTFENTTTPIYNSVMGVFFDIPDVGTRTAVPLLDLTSADIRNSSGVYFEVDDKIENFPGGNSLTPKFEENFSAGSVGTKDPKFNRVQNGIDADGEQLSVGFDVANGYTLEDIIQGLEDGSLRIGLHVQAIEGGGSDSYLAGNPRHPVVPVPGAVLLSMLGLSSAGCLLRRKC